MHTLMGSQSRTYMGSGVDKHGTRHREKRGFRAADGVCLAVWFAVQDLASRPAAPQGLSSSSPGRQSRTRDKVQRMLSMCCTFAEHYDQDEAIPYAYTSYSVSKDDPGSAGGIVIVAQKPQAKCVYVQDCLRASSLRLFH